MAEILSDLPEAIQLSSAILLYDVVGSDFYQEGSRLATVHNIHLTDHGPLLGSGTPLSESALTHLAKQLTKSKNLCQLLPKQVIANGNGNILWVSNPKPRAMWLAQSSVQGQLVPHPKLVFHWSESGLGVYAIKCKGRPSLKTKLFQAPYYNVNCNGHICMGSVRLPHTLDPSQINQVEKAFFRSEFTHPHHHGTKLTNCSLPHIEMWESLIGKNKFPTAWLAESSKVLEDILQ